MTLAELHVRRTSLPLVDGWSFVPDPDVTLEPGALPDGEAIRVPGSWEDHTGRLGGLVTAWYRRALEIPADWTGDDVRLRFGAVMASCSVYLDGELAGAHEGGYLPFEIDLTDRVRPATAHELALRVRNPFGVFDHQPVYSEPGAIDAAAAVLGEELTAAPGGKQTWYTSTSGLVRPVSLERRPRVHIGPLAVRPDLAGRRAAIDWSIAGLPTAAGNGGDANHRLSIDVLDPDGRGVASWTRDVVHAGDAGTAEVTIPDAVAWELGAPALYRAEARLATDADGTSDVVAARFGMRDVGTREGRVTLNGHPVFLLGALDQDYYPDTRSTPPSRAVLDDQVKKARELGLNLLRCHITIPDEAYLDAADEAGLLVWCELPNWNRFSPAAAAAGLATLTDMVASLGNHPSIVAWTIINEDWGTDLRHAADQRRWLATAYDHLRRLDPTRLIVDNSACGGPGHENFHVRTDLADFHVYHLAPDHAEAWRDRVADFAERPRWLWSPDGDAHERGDEPLILSEFGSWGLPDPRAFVAADGAEPWWFETGPLAGRPGGTEARIEALGLDRRFDGIAGLVRATQEHQWEALRYEIAELRRHPSISGYVITELSDVYWEANGLLDLARRPKAFHDRFAAVNAATVVIGDLRERDWVEGDRIRVPVTASAWDGREAAGGHVDWAIEVAGVQAGPSGRIDFDSWPSWTAAVVGEVDARLPEVAAASRATLRLVLRDRDGGARATAEVPFSIVPRRIAGDDVAALASRSGVQVVDRLDRALLDRVRAGARVVVLATDTGSIEPDLDLPTPLRVHSRSVAHPERPSAGAVWAGDWISTFAWADSEALAGLTKGRLLDLAFRRVLPDHVLIGDGLDLDPSIVTAGMFAGWVHAPAAITASIPVGAGHIVATTLRLDPGNGPMAHALLADLVRSAAASTRAGAGAVMPDTSRHPPAKSVGGTELEAAPRTRRRRGDGRDAQQYLAPGGRECGRAGVAPGGMWLPGRRRERRTRRDGPAAADRGANDVGRSVRRAYGAPQPVGRPLDLDVPPGRRREVPQGLQGGLREALPERLT